jgi:hypothetical protein
MEGLRKRKAESPLEKRAKRSRSTMRTKRSSTGTKRIRSKTTKRSSTGTKRSSTGTKRIRSGTKRTKRSSTGSSPMTRSKSKIYNTASKKISQFFKQTQHTRKANYLMTVNKALCSDAGVCLAVGTLAEAIKQHFHGFTPFDYVVSPIKKIGAESANGFINQINYSHRGYNACALLKSSKTEDSDNLLYEYVVGQYINKMNKQYPCFLETYGHYMYTDEDAWLKMQTEPVIADVSILKGLSLQKSLDYNDACRESKKLAILIQYFQGIQSLQKMSLDPMFIQTELMSALFQLYAPLARMKNNFTHYDLHLENVYLYKPVEGKYIQYHYYLSSTRTISFKSSYMVKIIDYGRSYFKDGAVNSKQIYEKELCEYATECNEPEEVTGECGRKVGFGWLKKLSANPAKDYYISAQRRNMSHDLLPLTRIAENHSAVNGLTPELNSLLRKVVYTGYYGTGEIDDSGYPNAIYNVQDAADFIAAYMKRKKFIDQNEEVYAEKEKLGDLHVYTDGRTMEFFPTTSSEA